MARTPYAPTVDVNPTGPVGGFLTTGASPLDFGAAGAAGTQRLGAGMEQAGGNLLETAITFQERQNQTATDEAFNQLQSRYMNRLYGDPNNPSVPGYFSLKGRAALDARADIARGMEDDRAAIAGTLQNDAQRMQFDHASRRLSLYQQEAVGRYADAQFATWQVATQQAGIETKLRAIGNESNSDLAFRNNLADLESAAEKKAIAAGGGPEIIAAEKAKVREDAYTQRALGISRYDPTGALDFVRQNEDQFSPAAFTRLQTQLHSKAIGVESSNIANSVMRGGVGGDDPLFGAIKGQEGSGAQAVSVDGARGTMQIMPATFGRYARPGEDIHRDSETVGRRIINDLSLKYGGDPSRVAVAYFSGEGNVAPLGSPTPWKEDKRDGNGTSTSAYVRGVLSRMGPQGPLPDRNLAYQRAIDLTNDDPQLQQMTLLKIERQFALEDRARREAQESAGQKIIQKLQSDPANFDPAMITNDPALTWQQKNSLWGIAKEQTRQENSHDVKTYGNGFYDLYQRVHLPQGSPERITDPSELWGHVGPNGDLTLSGVDRLTQEIQGRRTPDGEAESSMKKQFLDNARQQISGTDPLWKINDPRGDELYLKFLAQFWPLYDAKRREGATASQLLDPNSKDYLGSSIANFKRPAGEFLKDQMNGSLPVAASEGGPGTQAQGPDLKSRDGIVTAYKAGRISRQQAEEALISGGFAVARPAAPAPVPHPSAPTN